MAKEGAQLRRNCNGSQSQCGINIFGTHMLGDEKETQIYPA